jgi:preprotein translocase subunit SecB
MDETSTPQAPNDGPQNDGQDNSAPAVGVIAQYIKDFSFENPNAPRTLQAAQQNAPKIEVNVGVNARKLSEDVYEVELKIDITARIEEDVAYVVDLLYSGLFGARNLPNDVLEQFLIITAPGLLFPFARRILSDAIRDGGFPELNLQPIDFGQLYLQRQAQLAAQNGHAGAGEGLNL